MTALIDAREDERDRGLVERHQAGDDAAFAELYVLHYGRLVRFCRRLLRDPHLAEEVAQDAFLRAYTAVDRLEGERRFYPWLTVIARRLVIDRVRHDGRIEPRSHVDARETGTVEDLVVQRIDGDHLAIALDRVRDRHREVLHLRDWEGLSYEAIAARLDLAPTAIPPLLHRARAAVRREYLLLTEGKVAALLPLGAILDGVRRLRDRVAQWTAWLPDAGVIAAPMAGAVLSLGVLLAPLSGLDAGQGAARVVDATAVDSETVPAAATPSSTRFGRGLPPHAVTRSGDPARAPVPERVVVPDVAAVTVDDRQPLQERRERYGDYPVYEEVGPVTLALHPDEDRRHWERMVNRTIP